LLAYFIQQLQDERETQRAWDSYHAIRRFAEGEACRHRQICLHFGETPKWEKCNACDICAAVPDWFDLKRAREVSRPPAARRVSPAPDSAMLTHMREWRRTFARQRGVPAFMILNDASLADLCAREPENLNDLLSVIGIGEKKAQSFGKEILKALHEFGSRASKS
jgi:ATP-dependent DNA helicase RecQ